MVEEFFFTFSYVTVCGGVSTDRSGGACDGRADLPLPCKRLTLDEVSRRPSPSRQQSAGSVSPSIGKPLRPRGAPDRNG